MNQTNEYENQKNLNLLKTASEARATKAERIEKLHELNSGARFIRFCHLMKCGIL